MTRMEVTAWYSRNANEWFVTLRRANDNKRFNLPLRDARALADRLVDIAENVEERNP